jgi:phosphatidylserine/phosphatidylglycerophosphate/cardiolipin synthase-like enzyme
MKQIHYLLMCIVFNMSSMHIVRAARKHMHKNMQLCLNDTPQNFGTTHFIVGYHEKVPTSLSRRGPKEHTRRRSHNIIINEPSTIDTDRISQSFFTTLQELSPIILEVMSEAKTCLHIAAFHLTDIRVVDQVKNAHKNGLDVCVITDASNMKSAHSKLNHLIDNGVEVWCYKPTLNSKYKKKGLSDPLMHHKLIIADDCVVTGSANLTKAGQKDNIENITILRDKKTVDEHHAEFERLKKYCVKCKHAIE